MTNPLDLSSEGPIYIYLRQSKEFGRARCHEKSVDIVCAGAKT